MANMLKAHAAKPKDASFALFEAAMAASPTGLVIAAAVMAAFAGFPILLLCKDYFLTEYTLRLTQGCLERRLAP
jgi:hypothetical protein